MLQFIKTKWISAPFGTEYPSNVCDDLENFFSHNVIITFLREKTDRMFMSGGHWECGQQKLSAGVICKKFSSAYCIEFKSFDQTCL